MSGFSAEIPSFELPCSVGRKMLLKLIARGGMGDVYLAATTGLEGAERPCVVKTVRRDHISDGSFLARFLDEARVQAQLNHPGVAQVIEASMDDNGEPYTVVEYVEGRSLAEVRQRASQLGHKLTWADAVAITVEMAQALGHVHTRAGADGVPLGIVHRDLSPQNVMVGYGGDVKLIDFGTARGQNRKCHTVAGVVFAKPGYVAPEIARHEVGDGRIDVYAVGVMLWELCKGVRLLAGDPQKHLEEVARGRITVPPIAKSVGAPKELDDVLMKLIANSPDDRYENAFIAAQELAKLLAHAPATKGGERSVRARIAELMAAVYPAEPGRSRAEFARLLQEAKAAIPEAHTPPASGVVETAAKKMAEDPSLLGGTPYRLVRKIGEGSTATVWEAEHVELNRKLAVKVLDTSHSSALDSIDRFRKEARAVANLRHPNLAFLHDFGKSLDGRIFLAMEYLEGETLARLLERRELALDPLPWRDGVGFAIEATRALEAAHDAGLVHRDLKPENLFVTHDGVLKLLDFGVAIAKSDSKTDEKKQRGFAIFGTPEYMAPEQVAGEPVDARCDIYALGAVLYELCTGTRPFAGNSAVEVMGKQLRETVEAPSKRAPTRCIPVALESVIMKAMAKKPEDRFATAIEMREALEEAVHGVKRKKERMRKQLTAAFSAVLAATVAVGVSYRETIVSALRTTEPVTEAAVRVEDLPRVPGPVEADPGTATSVTAAAVAPIAQPTDGIAAQGTSMSPVANVSRPAPNASTVDALDHARAFAKAHPRDAKAQRGWARAALRAKNYSDAQAAAEAWSQVDPSSEPRVVLALALDGMGHKSEARIVLESYLKSHPHSDDAKNTLARIEPNAKREPGNGRVESEPRLERARASKPASTSSTMPPLPR
jgi:eukaryotic-like serine/threonine-protein kinase